MGLYDTYGDTQLKNGPCCLADYKIGDEVDIKDGLYIGWGGFVLVKDGRLAGEWRSVTDSHGDHHDADDVLGRLWGV